MGGLSRPAGPALSYDPPHDDGTGVDPLKGVALAESLYGDPRLRMCSDLDVLVPRHMVREAFRLLLADGYERANPYPVALADVDFLVRNAMEY